MNYHLSLGNTLKNATTFQKVAFGIVTFATLVIWLSVFLIVSSHLTFVHDWLPIEYMLFLLPFSLMLLVGFELVFKARKEELLFYEYLRMRSILVMGAILCWLSAVLSLLSVIVSKVGT